MRRSCLSHTLRAIACFLLLVLVGSGQAYLSAHFHHLHFPDAMASEISSRPFSAAAQPSDHHHHDAQSSHGDEQGPHYHSKNHGPLARTKSAAKTAHPPFGLLFAVGPLPVAGRIASRIDYQAPAFVAERYDPFRIIRGPPFLS